MKRFILFIFTLLILLITVSCTVQTRQDKVLASVGKYESKQLWTHGEFQDYTDFGVYTFSSAKLKDNAYFSVVTEDGIETICAFVDDFEKWIDAFKDNDPDDALVSNYSFDRSVIDTGDYFYIYQGDSDSEYACYDLWIFDTQTNTLYYFHNNI